MENLTTKNSSQFLNDVIEGLSSRKKSLSSRWFYDEEGSELFDQITKLPEYYLMRTETAILQKYATDITVSFESDVAIVEYGAGSARKVRILLDANNGIRMYLPFDISVEHMDRTVAKLKQEYPQLLIKPISGDFMEKGVNLEDIQEHWKRVGFFSGSTIGNLSNQQIAKFMSSARSTLGTDGILLVGIDLPKPLDVLMPAYNDADGITERFNLNILKRANRELGANFDLGAFQHSAIWNEGESRVEMHLVSLLNQTATIKNRTFSFKKGETIHTENSRKMSIEFLSQIIDDWTVDKYWTDENNYFALVMLR